MFMNQFLVGDKQHQTYGNENEVEFGEDDNQDVVFFSGETLEEVNKQIREELKIPIFYLSYLPDGFIVEEASYDKSYRIINMQLVNENSEYVYIFQQKQVDERASGIISDNNESITVENRHLNKKISIYKANRDNSWTFDINENGIVFSVSAFLSEEECVKIAENIKYY